MRLLRPGQETVLSWRSGAVECRVVAAAGHYILLRPQPAGPDSEPPTGSCSLTYLDGMVPMGWDGSVEAGAHPGELRFRVLENAQAADRRSTVRVPVFATVRVETGEEVLDGRLIDVSAGGMRFRNPGRIPAGTLLRVHAELPEEIVVDADAVVRTSERGITSVEFTAMRGTDAHTIGAWTVAVLRASLTGQG